MSVIIERVRLLASNFSKEELPLLSGMSPPLVSQYLELMEQYVLATSPKTKVRRSASS